MSRVHEIYMTYEGVVYAVLYNRFLRIAKTLNEELNITPLLYGSLGLERASNISFDPQDIDILVPKRYLNGELWLTLKETLENIGYTLVDLEEHAFSKQAVMIGIATIEDLYPFAEIDYTELSVVDNEGIKYKVLDLNDYMKVYNQSLKDGYRKTKNKQDQDKIDKIKTLL